MLAVLHGFLPSHWLAFVAVGRYRRWRHSYTLAVAALTGAAHLLTTIVLGLMLAFSGKKLWGLMNMPPQVEQFTVALVLVALGLFFAFQSLQHARHNHSHPTPQQLGDKGIIAALFLGMVLSPCLDLLPLYVAGAAQPWAVLSAVSAVFMVVPLAIMLSLVWLSLQGLQRLRFEAIERFEGVFIGGVLILLGVGLAFFK